VWNPGSADWQHFRAELSASRRMLTGPHAESLRILIVDENVESADSLATLSRAYGDADVRVAYGGADALALVVEFLPTVVLIDLDLTDMNGYDVARLLSRNPRLQNLRLIALTDSDEHAGRERAREAGFERYLLKPVAPAALEKLLSQHPA
jgi:CheY-like chemotaxis protein